jgi:hypothetical protein
MKRVVSMTVLGCERCGVTAQFEDSNKIDWGTLSLKPPATSGLVDDPEVPRKGYPGCGEVCASCLEDFLKWWRKGVPRYTGSL